VLDSSQIRDLDHMRVSQAEVALMDLHRPSHGVGQEIEMSVFMPTIGFSQVKVSRLVKGMPGMLILHYNDDKELISFTRLHYKKEPFYLGSCPKHKSKVSLKVKFVFSVNLRTISTRCKKDYLSSYEGHKEFK